MVGSSSAGRARGDLVGRAEELAVLARALERGGCVLAGATGVGKSRLAAEAAARRGAPVVRVVATQAAAPVPFGAFAHLLASVQTDARGPIAACTEALRLRSADLPPTLVVDDAHLLDEASAALVLAVCQDAAARLLVTLRHGQPVPDAITALWKDLHLDRLDLEALSRRELRVLVEGHLGGPAAPNVHARVFSLTEGNPLLAHELLIDARRSGSLAEIDGRWHWTGAPPRLVRLRELIGARTDALSPDGRLALELLVVAGSLRLDELAAASSHDATAELERAGIVTVRGDPELLTVELAHPVFGEVTSAELPAATAREHRRRLAAALGQPDPSDPRAVLRLATLKLEAGEADPELFLRASQHALEDQAGVPGPGWAGGDPPLAIRLADAAGPTLEGALLGARACTALSRFSEVEKRLAPVEAAAAQAPLDHAADYLRSRVGALHWDDDADGALALLDRSHSWRDEPDWAAMQATLRAWILLDVQGPASAAGAVSWLLDHDDLSLRVRLDALVVLGVALGRLGQADRCEALEPEVTRLVDELEHGSLDTGWARYVVDAYGRGESGRDLEGAAQRLREGRNGAEAAGNVTLAAALGLALGRLELTRGHAGEAIDLLVEAVDGLAAGDPRNGLGWALTYLTRAHAMVGDAARARITLARAETVAAERHRPRLQLEIERARAWIDAACGQLKAARDRLTAVADEAGEGVPLEAEALYDALRFGATPRSCGPRLRELAARAHSDLLDAIADHATAMAAADPDAQLQAAERFAGLGLDLFAAEAAGGAALDFAAQGRQSPTRRASALAVKHAALCPQATTPMLALTPQSERLTARELEIATRAAAGLSNAEIAEEMVLSIRTVETYILRACRKVGVDRRTDLAKVLTPRAPSPVTGPRRPDHVVWSDPIGQDGG